MVREKAESALVNMMGIRLWRWAFYLPTKEEERES
jgi:hypothetical protein